MWHRTWIQIKKLHNILLYFVVELIWLKNEDFKYLVAENCSGYEPNGISNAVINSYISSSCNDCAYYSNGQCKKRLYESMVMDIFKNN